MQFEEFFQHATKRLPYQYQITFANSELLPDLLQAPTGSGKTATAVLGWLFRRLHGSEAQRAEAGNRLVFCLPMRTLVEQTEKNVKQWRAALGLTEEQLGVHVLLGGRVDKDWHNAPDLPTIVIGTQDQLLSRALFRGYGMSRYMWPVDFAFLNSDAVWVMDEVQLMGVGASTAAQLQGFREQLQVAGTCKTVWMTATLNVDKLRTVDFKRPLVALPFQANETPLLERMNAKKSLQRAQTQQSKKFVADLAAEIFAAHEEGTLTLVVVNRVARAQELFTLLRKNKAVAVSLIHSRFRPNDRARIQQAALSGEFRGILVATQAIEAGVDISAKTLFTELAPWASMVQRFGRLNREGKFSESRAIWIDIDTNDEKACLPYEAHALVDARNKLCTQFDASPSSLSRVEVSAEKPTLPVIRRKDLLELFDTEPDLAGHDIDISRYVRATEDRDVQIAWRDLGDENPSPDIPALHRDELCSVPIWDAKDLLEKTTHAAWRFDGLTRRWVKADARRLIPGTMLLVDVKAGGYHAEIGFTKNPKDVPTDLQSTGGPSSEADETDELTYWSTDFVTLALHSQDAADEMALLVQNLASSLRFLADPNSLVEMARWHDLGKAHPIFQEMLMLHLEESDARRRAGPWAKSNNHNRMRGRRFFRHELASALAWIAEGRSNLGAYLIAAHHGKVRVTLRARPGEEPPGDDPSKQFAHGIVDGDILPSADLGGGVASRQHTLSLSCMALGGGGTAPSWAERMLGVLEEYGPFRLAFLEAVIRIADWRASRKRAPQGVKI